MPRSSYARYIEGIDINLTQLVFSAIRLDKSDWTRIENFPFSPIRTSPFCKFFIIVYIYKSLYSNNLFVIFHYLMIYTRLNYPFVSLIKFISYAIR